MQDAIIKVLQDVISSKKEDVKTEHELIRIHQQHRDALEKEIEALSFLLVYAPDLFKEVKEPKPKAKWFHDNFYNGNYKGENKENSEEKINTANVAAWSNGSVPPIQNPPPPKKESKTVSALIPKPELLKYIRTQLSLFPEEKPVHVFESEGQEYEFYYMDDSSLENDELEGLMFIHCVDVPNGIGMVYVFKFRCRHYNFKLKASKQPATNNY